MTRTDQTLRPLITLLGAAAVLLAALGQLGCAGAARTADAGGCDACPEAKFEMDRAAILGMAGEYAVGFSFRETVALRDGYELKEPYQAEANELVIVIEDTGDFISLQHLLVVGSGEKARVVKHWRQDWRYESGAGYDFRGDNVWEPLAYDDDAVGGAWVQSVYQVDDSPRYWGIGRWSHRDGVSTWVSGPTRRPLPRREATKRDDYQIVGAVNTHVVTQGGWMHYQSNHKLDRDHPTQPVIALESGVNTYVKTDGVDFSGAYDYWAKTAPYWAEVRAAWSEVYSRREAVRLQDRWKGDRLYTHLFDLSDLYWGKADASDARAQIDEVINAFMRADRVARP